MQGEKKQLDQLDFDDLIRGLRDALKGDNGQALKAALFEQFPAALVDEFQDTDPDQYQILQRIYGDEPDCFLCMIGDPKQAIYSFRGGDIFSYLKAGDDADERWTMDTNYRSNPAVIAGYNRAFLQGDDETNETVFHFGIEYHRIKAPAGKENDLFSDQQPAMQWRNFLPSTPNEKGETQEFQNVIAEWVVQEIVRLLSQVTRNGRAIETSDIAILVRSYSQADLLQKWLAKAGLASVYLSTRENIFQTEEASSLQQLLFGLWQPEDERKFIAALASSWIGCSPLQLDEIGGNEHLWAKWQNLFFSWREQWLERGLLSVLLEILQQYNRTPQQERRLTNCLHLAERLQMESNRHRHPDALLHWYEQALQESSGADENLLRLESDETLIRIITMHGAKGMEYPIVFLPFISYGNAGYRARAVYRYHDREAYSLQQSFWASTEEKQLTDEEEKAELIRLLYVAMTRAESRLYACLAPFKTFGDSMVGQLLQAQTYNLDSFREKVMVPGSAELIDVHEGHIALALWHQECEQHIFAPAQFHGHIERDWWLSSFSSLTRYAGHSAHTVPDRDEEEVVVRPVQNKDLPLRFALAKGAEAGNLLHDTMERCDFFLPDFPMLFQFAQERYAALWETFTADAWQQWLGEILTTPFLEKTRLADLQLVRTLRETDFYFPMHGAPIGELATFIGRRRGEPYSLPEYHKLKGMMHGFIDLIFERDGRYFVADYKSNYLGDRLDDYTSAAIRQNIHEHHYDVQYSLYSLALHRFLRGRIADYDPQRHLGGVFYFYLRGMHPQGSGGIFFDSFSPEDLQQLDTIFMGEAS